MEKPQKSVVSLGTRSTNSGIFMDFPYLSSSSTNKGGAGGLQPLI